MRQGDASWCRTFSPAIDVLPWAGEGINIDIKAIIFDFDGTLVDYHGADRNALVKVWEQLKCGPEFEDLYQQSGKEVMKFHTLVEQGKAEPEEEHGYRLRATFKHFSLPWREELLALYTHFFHTDCPIFPGARELLANLSQRLPLALLTNAYHGAEQRKRIQISGLAEFFNVIVISGEIGCYKPVGEAFWAVAQGLGKEPNECLMVGNSEKHDILGAKAAGMKAAKILHRPLRSGEMSSGDLICRDLSDLARMLC